MTDSNPTRARYTKNKRAFHDVIGDPFANEDVEGHYQRMKYRSPISAAQNNFGEGAPTIYAGRPNSIDFCCDVERVINEVFINDPDLFEKFIALWIMQIDPGDSAWGVTLDQMQWIEQRMGHLFLVKGLSPVAKYFAVTKRRPHGN